MSVAERMKRRHEADLEYLASLSDTQWRLWKEWRDVIMADNPEAVAHRIEVRREHRRLPMPPPEELED